jgi:hypothetical protein
MKAIMEFERKICCHDRLPETRKRSFYAKGGHHITYADIECLSIPMPSESNPSLKKLCRTALEYTRLVSLTLHASEGPAFVDTIASWAIMDTVQNLEILYYIEVSFSYFAFLWHPTLHFNY